MSEGRGAQRSWGEEGIQQDNGWLALEFRGLALSSSSCLFFNIPGWWVVGLMPVNAEQ